MGIIQRVFGSGQPKPPIDYSDKVKEPTQKWGAGLKAKIFLDKWLHTSGGKLYKASKDAMVNEQAEGLATEFGLTKAVILGSSTKARITKQIPSSGKERLAVLEDLGGLIKKSNSLEKQSKYYLELAQNYRRRAQTHVFRSHNTNQDNEKAAECFIKALSIDPKNQAAQEGLVESLVEIAKREDIPAYLQDTAGNKRLEKLEPETLISLAKQLSHKTTRETNKAFDLRKAELVFNLYQWALVENPDNANAITNNTNALTGIGHCYLTGFNPKPDLLYGKPSFTDQPSFIKAFDCFVKVLSTHPNNKDAQDGLLQSIVGIVKDGRQSRREGISNELVGGLFEALSSETLNNLAYQLQNNIKYQPQNKKDHETAFKLYRAALKKDPKNVDALANIGHCYLNGFGVKQDLDKAAKCFQDALPGYRSILDKDPKNANALAHIGYCHLKGFGVRESHITATKCFIKALETDMYNMHAIDGLVQIIREQGGVSEELEGQLETAKDDKGVKSVKGWTLSWLAHLFEKENPEASKKLYNLAYADKDRPKFHKSAL